MGPSECPQSALRVPSEFPQFLQLDYQLELRSECVPSAFRVRSECAQSALRVPSECPQRALGTHSERTRNALGTHSECTRNSIRIDKPIEETEETLRAL